MNPSPDAVSHRKVPLVTELNIVIDIEAPDLGHPDRPGLWDSLHQNCRVGVLICACCGHPLYVQERDGFRVVCTFTDAQIAAQTGESGEHLAFKAAIATLAERVGLTAEQESAGDGRKRITDVIVRGGARPVGWEVQLSPIQKASLKRRLDRATDDGLAPSWLTHDFSPARATLTDRSPVSMAVGQPTALEITAAPDMRVRAVKGIRAVRCTRHRSMSWHRGIVCSGWHCEPSTDQLGIQTLGAMVEKSAAGDLVPFRWPRSSQFYRNGFWLWVSREHADLFRSVEGGNQEQTPAPKVEPDRPVFGRDGWHTTAPVPLPVPRRSVDWEASPDDLLGPGCPECGWRRGQHRPAVRVGASELRACSRTP